MLDAFSEAVIRSVESIIQPDAKDAVREMGARDGLSTSRTGEAEASEDRNTDDHICTVERAKVHVKALYFVGQPGN